MEFNHGVLFSDTYQKKLKSQFYYADKDPQYGARLFFENSGGSLRLKKAACRRGFVVGWLLGCRESAKSVLQKSELASCSRSDSGLL